MHEVIYHNEVVAFSTMSENLTLMITIKPTMFALLLGKDRASYENDIIGLIRAELYERPK